MRRIFLFLCLILILCMSVSAETDYSYWETHLYAWPNTITVGTPTVIPFWGDSAPIETITGNEMCQDAGYYSLANSAAVGGFKQIAGKLNTGAVSTTWISSPITDGTDFGILYPDTLQFYSNSGATLSTLSNYGDGTGYQSLANCCVAEGCGSYAATSDNIVYVYHAGNQPLVSDFDYTPSNPIIDDTLEFISFSTPVEKIDYYYWKIIDNSDGALMASALNMDRFTYKGLSVGVYNVSLVVGNTSTNVYDESFKLLELKSGIEVINRVNIKDASTQSLISGAELQIYNQNNGVWINSSYLYTGSSIFPANQSEVVDIYAQAENFFPAEKLGYIIPKTGGIISLLLSPDAPATNESLNRIQIIVKEDDTSNPISNVKLTVNQGGYTIVKYTNNDGYAVFELDPELTANILATKSGYYELSKVLDISSPSSVDELRLTKITVAPTPTYTIPTPTLPAGQTGGGYNPVTGEYEPYYDPETGVYVAPTFVGGWGETEFEENICIKAPYPSNWGYMDILQNGIACNGVKGAVNQKLILSLIIITFIALVLSRYAKGTGALAGGIVGSLVCMGMGLLPIWIAILMIVICGIVIAKMIIGGAK